MDKEKICETVTRLRDEPEQRETILHYLGNRTMSELQTITGRKRNYYRVMNELQYLFKNDLELEAWALILAAADYRKNRPHSAKVLTQISQEREERKERHRYKELTVSQKIRRDFDEISTYYRIGMTWQQIRTQLKKKYAYRKEPLHIDTLRKTYKAIEREIYK